MSKNQESRITFEYHFKYFNLYQEYFSITSIGWENQKNHQQYFINNLIRPEKKMVFQYTVSGEGAITINSHTYKLKPGQAFLIECPSATQYFLPKTSDHWELKFIAFNDKSGTILKNIINEYGNIFTLPSSCDVLDYWEELYQLALNKEIDNFFTTSSYAYTFMMKLHDTLRNTANSHLSNNRMQNCLNIIHANYKNNLTLKQLADICNLSPSYLTKLFKENFKVAPIQYLIEYRIEMACQMLIKTDLSIEDIALQTGFNSANYFSRTFKSVVGISPKDYRKRECQKIISLEESQQLITRNEMVE